MANLINHPDGDSAMTLKNFRKDIVIILLNLQGAVAIFYKVHRAQISEYQSLPDFGAGTTNTVGIQSIKLEYEGWECDNAVSEPSES